MKKNILILFIMLASVSFAQQEVGVFQFNKDIGNPTLKGSATYNEDTQEYTLKGAGYNIWFERDEFNYLFNKIKGDFILTANFAFEGVGEDPHRKIGWMIRESEEENAAHCSAVLHGDGLTVMQWRVLQGALMRDPQDEIFAPKPNYQILQLERVGNQIIFRAAHPWEPLQEIGRTEMEFPEEVLAGLFITSHNPDVIETAKIWNVRIDQPIPDDYNPGREGWIGCRLETMNVFDMKRKVIFEKPGRFEAPNWMPGGDKLLFNMDGSLYKIPVEGGDLEKLNTGFADQLNNDHGISFDGKLLAISHSRDGAGGRGSSVYVLPLEGGTPQEITNAVPSYWHGWAPNNKEVVYVARRNGVPVYNIYKNSIKGGKEVALTDIKVGEHVDGCEYSPDGKYIYYNGSHSGTIITRM